MLYFNNVCFAGILCDYGVYWYFYSGVGSLSLPTSNGVGITSGVPAISSMPVPPITVPSIESIGIPSECLLLNNMFDPDLEVSCVIWQLTSQHWFFNKLFSCFLFIFFTGRARFWSRYYGRRTIRMLKIWKIEAHLCWEVSCFLLVVGRWQNGLGWYC